jgi:DNA-binding GntR family transcriptional regulator
MADLLQELTLRGVVQGAGPVIRRKTRRAESALTQLEGLAFNARSQGDELQAELLEAAARALRPELVIELTATPCEACGEAP